VAVKFCFVLGETAEKTVAMLETACKKAALEKTEVLEVIQFLTQNNMT